MPARLHDTPIQRKLMTILLLTSGAVVLLTCTLFFAYEFLTFRQTTARHLVTLGGIVATNSTAALIFENQDDAIETLSALKAEPHIVAAALYDKSGALFANYPADETATDFPAAPGGDGQRFATGSLVSFQPVIEGGQRRGTLYLKSDMGAMYERFRLYGLIVVLVVAVSFLVAYSISRFLQRQISQPILALAETAKAISVRRDYSVRATKQADDEVGLLTDAFNQMLTQIHDQDRALRDSEERFRMMFESNPLPMWVYDLETLGFLSVNEATIRHYGYNREEFLRLTISDIHPSEVPPPENPSTAEGDLAHPGVWNHRKKDGAIIQVEIASHELNFDGRRVCLVLVDDVTMRLKAEQEIRRLNDELERRVTERTAELQSVNKELEAFSYSISHDLRAPLRHIDGFAGLLAKHIDAKLDEKGRRYLATISDSAKRMGRLIDDLLSFSRMSRSAMSTLLVDQDALVAGVIRNGHFDRNVRPVEWKIAPLPKVNADQAMLQQVWFNLIDNAVKYSGKVEQPRVEVGCLDSDPSGEQVLFVRDNGVGFDMKYAGKLFGVFQRLHSADEFPGTGVGLANVYRIIVRHGGRIWAESEIGRGTTFYFSFSPKSA